MLDGGGTFPSHLQLLHPDCYLETNMSQRKRDEKLKKLDKLATTWL